MDVRDLARGGEAVVYRIDHMGIDEIVAKCPLFKPESSKDDLLLAYSSIFYES